MIRQRFAKRVDRPDCLCSIGTADQNENNRLFSSANFNKPKKRQALQQPFAIETLRHFNQHFALKQYLLFYVWLNRIYQRAGCRLRLLARQRLQRGG